MNMAKHRPGTVLTFYSYKGGVGRTMALANVAMLLARWGRRVLVVDFDLEAPGLERYFAAVPKDAERTGRAGVVDLLLTLQNRQPCLWQDALIRLEIDGGHGCLHLISAGRDDGAYIRRAQSLQYDALFADENLKFGDALTDLRKQWQQEYDYVLIDSRTGISDIGGICTILFPDILVMLFTANEQSVQGCADVIRRAKLAQENLPEDRWRLRAVPLLSRDERRAEFEQSEQWRPRIGEQMGEFFNDWLSQDVSAQAVLDTLYLPQVPYWSFGERLPVYERPADINDSGSLAAAYAKLGRLIDSGLDWTCVDLGDAAYQQEWRGRRLQELEAALVHAHAPSEREVILADSAALHRELYGPDDRRTLGAIRRHADQCFRDGAFSIARVQFEDLFYRSRRVLGIDAPETRSSLALLRQTLGQIGDHQALSVLPNDVELSATKLKNNENILAKKSESAAECYRQGKYRKAAELWSEVLESYQKSVGSDHPHTLTSMNNLAASLSAQGDHAVARTLQEQALDAFRRVLGPDHPDTLSSMNNLANTLYAQGDWVGAKMLQEQALEASRRVLGPDHPDTLTSMNNLASTLRALGDLAGAKILNEQELEASCRILGPDHPDTLTSMGNLASTLRALGDYASARTLHEEELDASRRILGPDHPDTLTSINNLATTLFAQGDWAGARVLHEEELEACRRVLGPDHPYTLTSMNNLAGTLRALGDLAGSRMLHEQELDVCRRILGLDHPHTLTSMNNLAGTLYALGDLDGARAMHEEALEARRRLLGPDHPHTLTSMNNLAGILFAQGDLAAARNLEEQALEASRRILGADHPDTLTSMNNLAGTLFAEGDLIAAKDLGEQALEASGRILGPNHPDTLITMGNVARTLRALGDLIKARALEEQIEKASAVRTGVD